MFSLLYNKRWIFLFYKFIKSKCFKIKWFFRIILCVLFVYSLFFSCGDRRRKGWVLEFFIKENVNLLNLYINIIKKKKGLGFFV